MDTKFFSKPGEQSLIKTRLVKKYLSSWATIMNIKSNSDKLGYIDLFCGPGIYEDGYESTPIQITKLILENHNYRNKFVLLFNDKNPDNINNLIESLNKLDGINDLKYSPIVKCTEVDQNLCEEFKKISLIPSLIFIDPFGYKGITKDLIHSMTKDWGCDCILFFNFNRINSGINNPKVLNHMKLLFGETRFEELHYIINNEPGITREEVILNQFSMSMKDIGIKYVLPFRFESADRKCTSHYLIFLTKNEIGYKIMKEIMANESMCDDNKIGTFEFIPSPSVQLTFLNNFKYSIPNLKEELLKTFSGKQYRVDSIYKLHNMDTPYILKNYKTALLELEEEGKIKAYPIIRPIRKGKKTLAGHVLITFP